MLNGSTTASINKKQLRSHNPRKNIEQKKGLRQTSSSEVHKFNSLTFFIASGKYEIPKFRKTGMIIQITQIVHYGILVKETKSSHDHLRCEYNNSKYEKNAKQETRRSPFFHNDVHLLRFVTAMKNDRMSRTSAGKTGDEKLFKVAMVLKNHSNIYEKWRHFKAPMFFIWDMANFAGISLSLSLKTVQELLFKLFLAVTREVVSSTPAGPSLRVLKQMRRKCCHVQLHLLVVRPSSLLG